MTARQMAATVAGIERAGAYYLFTLTEPGLGADFRPGQFAAVAVGGEQTSMLLRRCFSIHRADGDVMQLVIAGHGKGTRWLVGQAVGAVLDVVTPLGRPFPLPTIDPALPARAGPAAPTPTTGSAAGGSTAAAVGALTPATGSTASRSTAAPDSGRSACVLVGGGYGSAPLFALSDRLQARGHPVHFVLGAATEDRLFGVHQATALADSVTVTTDDGSAGRQGLVSDALPGLLADSAAETVYACGPMGMLHAVTEIATAAGVGAYCAVEESMACGIGVCMTCVLPVVWPDGRTRMTRSCTDGPVFDGSLVRWPDVGTVPADCVGAMGLGA
jgi:dihydroorotate dehydrogenase electron transfer subunit